ncbi:unnamed protein product [Durusdinium trenchii]|uniref:Uncharacterized protein n=2 Tax=Durusdinium trenchii TaxID=1381693 RepID=A0ABP0NW96_9DINO
MVSTVSPNAFHQDLMTKLNAAVDQLLQGAPWSAGRTSDPTVIELGPANPPKMEQAASFARLAPRLPQQLAELRRQLRALSADCDRLTGALTEGESSVVSARVEDEAIEQVEAIHASAMSRARVLLEELSERTELERAGVD